MSRRPDKSIGVLCAAGTLARAQGVWHVAQYLIGLRRLGFDPCYLQAAAPDVHLGLRTADESVGQVMRRIGFDDRWSILTPAEQLDACELVIQLDDVPPAAVPALERLARQGRVVRRGADAGLSPTVPDLWHPYRGPPSPPSFACHGSPDDIVGGGRHAIDLTPVPADARQRVEVVTGDDTGQAVALRRLADAGWAVRQSGPMLRDADWYRHYVVRSRGELVPEQTGGLPPRSAWHLAAGRPVVAHASLCHDLPTGAGLVAYADAAGAVAAIEAVNDNYERHCTAAAQIARDHLSADRILSDLLAPYGLSVAWPRPAPASAPVVVAPQRNARARGPIRFGGSDGHVLLASCLGDGDTGGGLFAIDADGTVEEIDRLSTAGLCLFADDAGRPAVGRALRSAEDSTGPVELLTYDRLGVTRYCRVDGVSDVHDLAWDGDGFVLVSTGTNTVAWVTPAGRVRRTWHPPGERKDAWHLNCLARHDGRLFVSAFGRFPTHRAWHGRAGQPDGFVLDLASGRDVLTGLSCPHNPRRDGDRWLVCNSAGGELLAIDADQTVARRLPLAGWTRGLAIGDDLLFVGESAKRRSPTARTASVAVVNRRAWEVIDRLSLPCREVYDLLLVPAELVGGLRAGFATNPLREAEQDQHALFRAAGVRPARLWATGEPLPPDACRVRIDADVDPSMVAGGEARVPCRVSNVGGAILISVPPNPVFVSYRWLDARTRRPVPIPDGPRTPLARPLPPGGSADVSVAVVAPPVGGDYVLRLTLVQEQVAWFDTLSADNAREFAIFVRPRPRDAQPEPEGARCSAPTP